MTDSAGGSSEHLLSDADDPREQDRYLPTANVARLMKKALPDNSKVAKEAKDCIMECVSEFISFVTSEASDRCVAEKRKTINGEDILWALQSLGFDSYCEVMKVYLSRYREVTKLERVTSLPPPQPPLDQEAPQNPSDSESAAVANQAFLYALAMQQQQQQYQQQMLQLREQQQQQQGGPQVVPQQQPRQQQQQLQPHQQQQQQPATDVTDPTLAQNQHPAGITQVPQFTPQQIQAAIAAHMAGQQSPHLQH